MRQKSLRTWTLRRTVPGLTNLVSHKPQLLSFFFSVKKYPHDIVMKRMQLFIMVQQCGLNVSVNLKF